MQPTGFQPTGFQPGPISAATGDVTVAGITLTVTPVVIAGSVTTTGTALAVTKPPGGDDAFHPGVQPRKVKTPERQREGISVEDLEATYNAVLGIEPQTKAEKRAVKAVQKAVQRHAEVSEPEASQVDWVAVQNDLNAVLALREAYERLLADEDEEALVALLLAA